MRPLPAAPPAGTVLPLGVVSDHLLIELEGSVSLIDTGAPMSIPAPELVSEELGTRVEWILGVDWLRDSAITIDWPARQIAFAQAAQAGEIVPLRPHFGLYQIEVATTSGTGLAFLDTGAQLSYAPPAECAGVEPVGARRDFYPGFGAFDVTVYQMPIRVGSREIHGTFGVLPDLLLSLLRMIGHGGWILGSDFFRDRRITLDLGNNRLVDVTGS